VTDTNTPYTVHTIVYGPDYANQVTALLGTRPSTYNQDARLIDNCVHTGGGTMRPFDTYCNLATGTVVKIIHYGISYDRVLVFADKAAYDAYETERRRAQLDPETLRMPGEMKITRGF
jgi:hypothetical protein